MVIMKRIVTYILIFLMITSTAEAVDTFFEDFNSHAENTTINDVNNWSVDAGDTDGAVTQSGKSFEGSGKALKIIGDENAVEVSRSENYGNLSPGWIEFLVNPGVGAESQDVPSGRIAGVTFDMNGKIYASDGSSWVDIGEMFTPDTWYRVILKLDFTTHMYDIYTSPASAPEVGFTPDKTGLHFIDSTINSINQIGFSGAHNESMPEDSYVDDLVIHFIDRVNFLTTSKKFDSGSVTSPITVQIQNSLLEPQTAWRDIYLALRSTSGTGEFSLTEEPWALITQVVIFEGGHSTSFYYKDSTDGKPVITVKEDPDRGWLEAFQEQEVLETPLGFEIAAETPQVAGEAFDVTFTAKKDSGEIETEYTGSINVSVSYVNPISGTMQISPQLVSGFVNGVTTLSFVYPDCGLIEIMAEDSDDDEKSGISGEIMMIPAGFGLASSVTEEGEIFEVDVDQIVARTFPIFVTAINEDGAITPNFTGSVNLSPVGIDPEETEGGVMTPQVISGNTFSGGTAEAQVSYDRWGKIQIQVSDANYPAQLGKSNEIMFDPDTIVLTVEYPSESRDFFYTGEEIPVSLSAVDANGQVIPNYLGEVEVSASFGMGIPGEYLFLPSDAGEHIFDASVDSSGMYYVDALEPTNNIHAETLKIEVKQVSIVVESTYAPVGTTEVTIRLVDEDGNVIYSESSLSILIEIKEEFEDFSALSSAQSQPVTFKNGVVKVSVSDSRAEIVTIWAVSDLDFEIKKGTITFGRITKTGVGSLMWRDISE